MVIDVEIYFNDFIYGLGSGFLLWILVSLLGWGIYKSFKFFE